MLRCGIADCGTRPVWAAASSQAPDGFDGVPHLTPEGMPLPVKVSLASVKILFSRGWVPYRKCCTSSMIGLRGRVVAIFVGPVEVASAIGLMVGYT